MMKQIFMAASLAAVLALSGCATKMDMPYSEDEPKPDPAKAVFLLSVTIKNDYHTNFQPDMLLLNVEKATATSKQDRLNFAMDDQGKDETDAEGTGNTYYARIELPPGEYVIRGVTCLSKHFPIIGNFFMPLQEKLTVTTAGVYYLGHADGTVRERKGDEFKAGPTLPLIDQAVAGASGGTFDVNISDQWDKDDTQFTSRFPALKGVNVQKDIMAPFDRAYAQKWWAAN